MCWTRRGKSDESSLDEDEDQEGRQHLNGSSKHSNKAKKNCQR